MEVFTKSAEHAVEWWRNASSSSVAAVAAASLVGAFVVKRALQRVTKKLKQVEPGESVLITGAGTGIGAACATYLADTAGFRVFAGVLSEAEGEALRAQAQHKDRIVPIVLDVTKQDQVEAAVRTVSASPLAATGGRLYGVLNNAGVGSLQGAIERTSVEEFRRVMEVNFFGTVAVTKAFLPLVKRAQGRIIILTSMSGRYSAPFMATYSASKYALEAFIDALRRETVGLGVKVVGIQPAIIKTDIIAREVKFIETVQDDPDYPQYRPWLRDFHNQVLTIGQPPVVIAQLVDDALRSPCPKIRYSAGGLLGFLRLLGQLPDAWADWVQHKGLSLLPKEPKLSYDL